MTLNKPDLERGILGSEVPPESINARAVKRGIGIETFSKAVDIVQNIIDQHIAALKALETIRQSMKNAEIASKESNIEDIIKSVTDLPQQYVIVANAGFKESELLNELTKLLTDAIKETGQGDYYLPGNKPSDDHDLRGYV